MCRGFEQSAIQLATAPKLKKKFSPALLRWQKFIGLDFSKKIIAP